MSTTPIYGPDTWYGFNARGEQVGAFPDRWSAESALAQRSVDSISPAVQPGDAATTCRDCGLTGATLTSKVSGKHIHQACLDAHIATVTTSAVYEAHIRRQWVTA